MQEILFTALQHLKYMHDFFSEKIPFYEPAEKTKMLKQFPYNLAAFDWGEASPIWKIRTRVTSAIDCVITRGWCTQTYKSPRRMIQ